jgi:hypothetical protein
MAPEYLICRSFDTSLHPNKWIGNVDSILPTSPTTTTVAMNESAFI